MVVLREGLFLMSEVPLYSRPHLPRGASRDLMETFVTTNSLEAHQGQMDGLFSQLPYKCHLEEVASVGD
jgi:hypothetical protein